jgi:hypothetical protein
MLDQLVRLTSQPSREDIDRRASLARAVFHASARAPDLYADLVGEPRPPERAQASRYRIYESACRALRVAPMHVREPRAQGQPARGVQRLMRMLKG